MAEENFALHEVHDLCELNSADPGLVLAAADRAGWHKSASPQISAKFHENPSTNTRVNKIDGRLVVLSVKTRRFDSKFGIISTKTCSLSGNITDFGNIIGAARKMFNVEPSQINQSGAAWIFSVLDGKREILGSNIDSDSLRAMRVGYVVSFSFMSDGDIESAVYSRSVIVK